MTQRYKKGPIDILKWKSIMLNYTYHSKWNGNQTALEN